MKGKPPYQVIALDDKGRELFTGYVALTPEPNQVNLNNADEAADFVATLAKAIAEPEVDKHTGKWILQ